MPAFSDGRRGPATLWAQAAPIEGVVPGLRGVVKDRGLLGLPRRGEDDLLERQIRERCAGNQLVQGVDISPVVLAVMKLQRPR